MLQRSSKAWTPAGLNRKVMVSAIVIMLGVSLVAVYSLYLNRSVSSQSWTSSISSVASKSGLRLTLTVNSTAVPFGGGIAIGIGERNVLQEVNNVSALYNWSVSGLYFEGPEAACPFRDAIGIAVFKGRYAAGNISTATSMQIVRDAGACFAPPLRYSYAFQPLSSNATEAYGCKTDAPSSLGNGTSCRCYPSSCPPLDTTPAKMQGSFAYKGYWFGGFYGFHYFPPGIYTVAGADEWGTLVLLHFEVSSPGCRTLQTFQPFPAMQSRMKGSPNVNGSWAFTLTLNSSVATGGETIRANGSLINMANNSQSVILVTPLLAGLQVLRSDGSVVWQYTPPSITTHRTLASGETIEDSVNIPTSQLQSGQTYTIVAQPGFYDQSLHPLWTQLTTIAGLSVC